MIYRQGDVLLVMIDSLPKDAEIVKNKDRIVLAYGEVTGHAHAISVIEAIEFKAKPVPVFDVQAERFIQVTEKALLKHEEHATIELPKGDYAILQQRVYTPEEIKRVED